MSTPFSLDAYIRKIPNFPKDGILFYDITEVLKHPIAMQFIIDNILEIYKDKEIDGIAALEARGFYFGPIVALRLQKPFYPIRKAGKLPGAVVSQEYDLEYGSSVLEMQLDPALNGKNILIVDDLIATGGTLLAAAQVLQRQGAIVSDLFGVMGLSFLNYEEILKEFRISTLINYNKETL
jgi:adenine phosphoribosyltransferase